MTDDDLELVRGAIQALNERDIDRVLEALDPEVELVTAKALFEGIEYQGHDGFRRYLADMGEDWEEFGYDLEELTPVGDDVALVTGRFRARGRTGSEVDLPGVWLCEVRGGRIVGVHFYADVEAARAPAGERAAH